MIRKNYCAPFLCPALFATIFLFFVVYKKMDFAAIGIF